MSAAEHRDNVRTPAASASGADAQLCAGETMATRDARAIHSLERIDSILGANAAGAAQQGAPWSSTTNT